MIAFAWGSFIAFAWGLAEALFLFIVPDLWLTHLAIRSTRGAIHGAIFAVAGSLLGAIALYGILGHRPDAFEAFHSLWRGLPGYRDPMATVAHDFLLRDGPRGLMAGPRSGLPYRVFVTEAWKLGLPLAPLLAWTIPARLERILLVPFLFIVLRFLLSRTALAPRTRAYLLNGIFAVYWIALYTWYWENFIPHRYG